MLNEDQIAARGARLARRDGREYGELRAVFEEGAMPPAPGVPNADPNAAAAFRVEEGYPAREAVP
jgi:hypothetical protein